MLSLFQGVKYTWWQLPVLLGVANGPSKTLGLAKFYSNFTGLAVSFFCGYVRLAVSFFISHLKQFEVSVSQSKKSKCLGLAKKNASLAVSQSLAFTIRHPSYSINIIYFAYLSSVYFSRCS